MCPCPRLRLALLGRASSAGRVAAAALGGGGQSTNGPTRLTPIASQRLQLRRRHRQLPGCILASTWATAARTSRFCRWDFASELCGQQAMDLPLSSPTRQAATRRGYIQGRRSHARTRLRAACRLQLCLWMQALVTKDTNRAVANGDDRGDRIGWARPWSGPRTSTNNLAPLAVTTRPGPRRPLRHPRRRVFPNLTADAPSPPLGQSQAAARHRLPTGIVCRGSRGGAKPHPRRTLPPPG